MASGENKFNKLFGENIPIIGTVYVGKNKPISESLSEYVEYVDSHLDGILLKPLPGEKDEVSPLVKTQFRLKANKLIDKKPLGLSMDDFWTAYRLAESMKLSFLLSPSVEKIMSASSDLTQDQFRDKFNRLALIGGIEDQLFAQDEIELLKKSYGYVDAYLYNNVHENAYTNNKMYNLFTRLNPYLNAKKPIVTTHLDEETQGSLLYPTLNGLIGDQYFRKGNTLEGKLDVDKVRDFMKTVSSYRADRKYIYPLKQA